VDDSRAAKALPRPQILIKGATKSFSGRVVVDVEELLLGERPIEGLIGPNGAGKTTLMRMIMHSTPLDGGTIEFVQTVEHGNSVVLLSDLPTHRMAGLGVVKSNQVIMDFNKLTIWDSLLLAASEAEFEQPHKIFSERSVYRRHENEIRAWLGFFPFADPTGFAQSAGEKKLLDIVRCLLLKPRFLLLDEPTAGLPKELTEKVMEAIKFLSAEGTTVVVVEHDLSLIWNICERVHFMAEGQVLLQGEPDEIRKHRTVIEKYLGKGHVAG
jgi:ABC-type branched-subunit amino acid transport system ATPase component